MSDEVHKVIITLAPPRGTFPGKVAEGYYVVFENYVILTDPDGKPVPGVAKFFLAPGENPRHRACQMVRANNSKGRSSAGDFNRRLEYPKLVY